VTYACMSILTPAPRDHLTSMTDISAETRTTCYAFRVAIAAKLLGLPSGSTADDVLKAVIAGTGQATLRQAREIVNKALSVYEEHG